MVRRAGVKILEKTLWWSFAGAAKKNRTRPRPGRKNGTFEMTFTGTLIENLMATVERAEAKAQDIQVTEIEPWFASVQENTDYDSKFIGVA
jgi:hypothetical protein